MAHGSWLATIGFLGMWMAMMVPMMLPSLVPMLARYRRSIRRAGAGAMYRHGLTALVGTGYFFVWGVLGGAAYAAGAGLMAAEIRWGPVARWLPLAAGVVLLVAGGVQLTPWKARQLRRCREASGCGGAPASNALGAWRNGVRLGVQCALCCSGLMLALLAMGMMNPVAMVAVTLTITAERLAPAPRWVTRVAGLAMVAVGAVTIARI